MKLHTLTLKDPRLLYNIIMYNDDVYTINYSLYSLLTLIKGVTIVSKRMVTKDLHGYTYQKNNP